MMAPDDVLGMAPTAAARVSHAVLCFMRFMLSSP